MQWFRIGVACLVVGGAIVAAACGSSSPVPRVAAPSAPSPTPSATPQTSVFEPPSAAASSQVRPSTLHALSPPGATPSPGQEQPLPPSQPQPEPTSTSRPAIQANVQLQLTNQARAAAGLAPLTWSSCLAPIAAGHAREMAAAGRIFHGDGVQRDLGCGAAPESSGENVGETPGGVDDQQIFDAFMASPGHRANILGAYRWFAAVWVVGADGNGYVSVEFLS